MKKINVLFLLFVGILGMSTITSCTPEENDDVMPSMIFSTDGAAIAANETVTIGAPLLFKISCNENPNTKKNLQSLRIQSFKNNSANIDTTVTINDVSYLGSFNFNADSAYSLEEKFEFTLTDKAGEKATKTITITTEDAPAAPNPVNTYSAKLLGGQSNATLGSYFDAHTGTVNLSSAAASASETIDLIFAYGISNQYYLGAPSNSDIQTSHSNVTGWTTKNVTYFESTSLSPTDFDAISNEDELPALSAGTTDTKISFLVTDNVFAFETTDGKKGLVKVVDTGGTMGSDRFIEIDVKVQQ